MLKKLKKVKVVDDDVDMVDVGESVKVKLKKRKVDEEISVCSLKFFKIDILS